MSDPCFANLLNCTSYRTCQLREQVDFIERYLGISGGTTLPEVDNCTIGDANQLHLITQNTSVPGRQAQGHTGYLRNAIVAQYPCSQLTATNFYLDVPFSPDGYGLAMGWNHNYPNTGSKRGSAILSGEANRNVSGPFSVICGGQNNTIADTIQYASIVGGAGNTAGGTASFIGGGTGNMTLGVYSFIGAGVGNSANTEYSAIVAGQNNATNSPNDFIGAGSNNTTLADCSFIGAGTNNKAGQVRGSNCVVVGGASNQAIGNNSAIVAGSGNTASGIASFISAGINNLASGNYSTVLGSNGSATHDNSFVFSGSVSTTSNGPNTLTMGNGIDLYYNGNAGNIGVTGSVLTLQNTSGLAQWGPVITSGTWTPVIGSGSTAYSVGNPSTLSQDTDPGHTNTGSYMRIGNIVQFSAVYYLKVGGASSFQSIDITSNLPPGLGRTGPADMAGLVGSYILFDVPLENINQQVVSFRYFNPSTITDNYSIKIGSNPGYPPGITNGIYIGDGIPFSVFVNGQYTLV